MKIFFNMIGFVRGTNDTLRDPTSVHPTKTTSTIFADFDAKLSSNIGIICPFTQQLIRFNFFKDIG